ncbi:nudix hydrolase 16, mitochondrial-like isoform X1 [Olea europaea var. sylvestris]|uniref:Nudix hydrolase 16, mitochondrial-like n=1 Tax=Olea europaea subsp. europaea TaxID=158383 RepID=A0A8S0SZU0_OLEEU|nr:nudix hydrolase 16, mitochondrial-like isoform X1 [Olea europaea var. sylvestris]CAA2997714.1 nudix hydrolase 16, mitochondrial-like [Olea europaea subsp. europaea]
MSELVARTGRQQQRYEDGFRLIAGCIPFKYGNVEGNVGDSSKKIIEVLMINSNSGPGLLFPKGGWENDETAEQAALREAMEEAGVRGDLVHFLGYYPFKSKTQLDEFSPEGWCKAAMYALLVKEELESWPEKSHRQRSWLTIPKAIDSCRHAWMRVALEKGFQNWYSEGMIHTLPKDVPKSSSNQR